MRQMKLFHTPIIKGTASFLPSSKSISNRALMLNALSKNQVQLKRVSQAHDTVLMQRGLQSPDPEINVQDAGTTMRFLIAYFSITNQYKHITGTPRLQKRPIGPLVDALTQLGANIKYVKKEGFVPVKIEGIKPQLTSDIRIASNISSQYISALMMIAPLLSKGLTIELTGTISSLPYIQMTASLMNQFGVKPEIDLHRKTIHIPSQAYHPVSSLTMESDWSAASYWFSFVALSDKAEVILPNLSTNSIQGDHIIVDVMHQLGVHCVEQKNQLVLSKKPFVSHLEWDFTSCPDLAQTIIPVCAAKGITGTFTGLDSLYIKETDRLKALQQELYKINAKLISKNSHTWELSPGQICTPIHIATYNDHRMAMGFSPWSTRTDLTIESPNVVIKSYPRFWSDVQNMSIPTEERKEIR